MRRRFVLGDVAGFKLRDDEALDARVAQRGEMGGVQHGAFLQHDSFIAHGMGEDAALGLIQRDGSEFHAAFSTRKGFLRNARMISPSTDTAISDGVTAPMS